MKISISLHRENFDKLGGIDAGFAALKEAGIEAIEYAFITPDIGWEDMKVGKYSKYFEDECFWEHANELKAAALKYGIAIDQCHAPMPSFISGATDEANEIFREYMVKTIEFCGFCNVKNLIIHPLFDGSYRFPKLTKVDVSASHEAFVEKIFRSDMPKPATEQTESIASIINNTVAENCSIELIQAVQAQLIELAQDHKANKEDEPLTLSAKDMGTLLRFGGVNEESIQSFSEQFEEDFGATAEITPANIIDIKKFEVKTPEVTVKVKPECSEMIQTRIIDGTKYLLIRADGDVEVNGIRININ